MNKLVRVFLAIFVAVLAFVAVSPRIYAFDAFEGTCDGSSQSSSSSVCQDNASGKGTTLADPNSGIVPKIANIVAAVGGVIAVVFVMINGFTIMTSTGDSQKISKARDGLIYAAVGIAIIVLARTIIALILRYL